VRRWQQHDFSARLSSFPRQFLRERVPAVRADIVFLVLNFSPQTILLFAAQVTDNHGLPPGLDALSYILSGLGQAAGGCESGYRDPRFL